MRKDIKVHAYLGARSYYIYNISFLYQDLYLLCPLYIKIQYNKMRSICYVQHRNPSVFGLVTTCAFNDIIAARLRLVING